MGDIQGADRTGVHRECPVRGGLVVWIRGLGRGIAFASVLTSESGSVILSSAAGGGSGGGLARVVLSSMSSDLIKDKAVSVFWGLVLSLPWEVC